VITNLENIFLYYTGYIMTILISGRRMLDFQLIMSVIIAKHFVPWKL